MSDETDKTEGHTAAGWNLCFQPHAGLLATCNDPKRMFRELGSLGELTVDANLDELPEFASLNPEDLLLSWQLTLMGTIEESAIREVFIWVEDDCDLHLTPVTTATIAPVAVTEACQKSPDATSSETVMPDKGSKSSGESSTIRVDTDKVDALVNLVGELVITQSMLNRFRSDYEFDVAAVDSLHDGLAELMRNTRELQESVMAIRMLPISLAFDRLPDLIHGHEKQLSKKVELKLAGETTEVDKTVLEKIRDALVHLVRNALDHGIETPAVRAAAGKPEAGVIELNAFHDGGSIVIQVIDDGAGINKDRVLALARERGLVGADEHPSDDQINNMIFAAGFSTTEKASDPAGRDVGMDIVKRNINELGGTLQVESEEGTGCRLTIRLPLTLAILEGQLLNVGDQTYIVPLVSIVETTQVTKSSVGSIAGQSEIFKIRDEYIPVVRLHEVFGIQPKSRDLADGLLVIVGAEGQRAGVFVDELGDQQQVVIKSLSANFRPVDGLSGATILADGSVALIIDVTGLMTILSDMNKNGRLAAAAA